MAAQDLFVLAGDSSAGENRLWRLERVRWRRANNFSLFKISITGLRHVTRQNDKIVTPEYSERHIIPGSGKSHVYGAQ